MKNAEQISIWAWPKTLKQCVTIISKIHSGVKIREDKCLQKCFAI